MADDLRPLAELRDSGLLWLINRVAFHPRGVALALHQTPEGEVTGRVLGIDDDGALRLAGPRGELRVVGGEVTVSGGYQSDGPPSDRSLG